MISVRKIALTAVAAGTLALAGCSSSSSGGAASSPTGAPSSPAAGATPSATGSPADSAPAGTSTPSTTSSAPSQGATASASSPAGEASSPKPSGDSAAAPNSELISLATKLGCANPKVVRPKSTSPAAKMGLKRAINCNAEPNQYIVAAATTVQQKKIIDVLMTKSWQDAKELGYVSDPGWMVIGGKADSPTPPTHADAVQIQKKIGGTVHTVKK